MSNHRPPTDPGASVASIATGVAATTITLALVAYILWGPLDDRDLIGAGLGLLLALLLFAQTVMRISDRLTARDRIRAYRRRQQAEAERLARIAKRAEPDPESDGYPQDVPEPPVAVHAQFEQEYGYDPGPTRLGPGGWPVPVAGPTVQRGDPTWATDETLIWPRAEGVDQTGDVGTETQRLDPGVYRSGGPSAAALTPIGVPVFRTEVERAAWAEERNLPPEALPYLPEGWPHQS